MKAFLSGLHKLVQHRAETSGSNSSEKTPQQMDSQENQSRAIVPFTGFPSPPLIEDISDDSQPDEVMQTLVPDLAETPMADPTENVVIQVSEGSSTEPEDALQPRASEIKSRLRKRKSPSPAASESKRQKKQEPAPRSSSRQTEVSKKSVLRQNPKSAEGFDQKRFTSIEAKKRYDFLSANGPKFIRERNLVVGNDDAALEPIRLAGLIRTVTDVQSFVNEVIWEFWSNLPRVKPEGDSVEVLVRGWVYEFSPSKINKLFCLPEVDERDVRTRLAAVLDDDLADFMTGGKVKKWAGILVSDFTEENKELYKICCRNWSPTKNDGYPQLGRAKIVYQVVHLLPINFGRMVFDHVLQLARSTQTKFFLPFPSLVHQLLMVERPVPLDDGEKGQPSAKAKKQSKKVLSQTPAGASSDFRGAVKLAIQILEDALLAGKFSSPFL